MDVKVIGKGGVEIDYKELVSSEKFQEQIKQAADLMVKIKKKRAQRCSNCKNNCCCGIPKINKSDT